MSLSIRGPKLQRFRALSGSIHNRGIVDLGFRVQGLGGFTMKSSRRAGPRHCPTSHLRVQGFRIQTLTSTNAEHHVYVHTYIHTYIHAYVIMYMGAHVYIYIYYLHTARAKERERERECVCVQIRFVAFRHSVSAKKQPRHLEPGAQTSLKHGASIKSQVKPSCRISRRSVSAPKMPLTGVQPPADSPDTTCDYSVHEALCSVLQCWHIPAVFKKPATPSALVAAGTNELWREECPNPDLADCEDWT